MSLESKDCAVVSPKDTPRKKNSRHFGDNMEDSDEHQSTMVKNQQDRGTARFPK